MYLISALDQSELHLYFYIFWIFTACVARGKTGSSNSIELQTDCPNVYTVIFVETSKPKRDKIISAMHFRSSQFLL